MPRYVIYHNGAFNLYSTIVDAPLFTCGIRESHIVQHLRMDGASTANQIADVIERAKKHGTSERGATLRQTVACNRAGPHEAEVPFDEFLKQYLTIREVE